MTEHRGSEQMGAMPLPWPVDAAALAMLDDVERGMSAGPWLADNGVVLTPTVCDQPDAKGSQYQIVSNDAYDGGCYLGLLRPGDALGIAHLRNHARGLIDAARRGRAAVEVLRRLLEAGADCVSHEGEPLACSADHRCSATDSDPHSPSCPWAEARAIVDRAPVRDLASEAVAALRALAGHAPELCWCQMAIGHPSVTRHSDACLNARRIVEAHDGGEG